MNKIYTFLLLLACTAACGQGVSVNSNGSPPDPSAMIDVSSTTKGALIPRMTQSQRDSISSPAFGLLVLNTSTGCINIFLGATWKQLCGECDFAAPVAGNNGPVCAGQTLNLTATFIPGATYQWAGPNGFTDTAQNPSIPIAIAGNGGLYSVQATLNGCTSTAQTTFATVNAIPQTPTAGSNAPVCAGQSLNLTATTIAGAAYSWTGPGGYTANTQNPEISGIHTSQAGKYSVGVTIAGCNSATDTTAATIDTVPPVPGTISGNTAVCPNASGLVYTINAVSTATGYNWTVPSGASISANADTAITVTFGSSPTGNITVAATNNCGAGSAATLGVTAFCLSASGGSTSTSGGYTYYTFTGSGTFTVTGSGNVEVLLVAGGGGGGGNGGGGGGGGGVVYDSSYAVSSGNYTVTVGGGGAGQSSQTPNNGANSSFGTLTAIGGGGAGSRYPNTAGNSGGSGGGGGGGNQNGSSTTGGNGTANQGNSGGGGTADLGCPSSGGGGGGAGSAGSAGASQTGGNGGNGITYFGTTYGGGGGGGVTCTPGTGGAGGSGGGGAGSASESNDGSPGTNGLGGGGGGGGSANTNPFGIGGNGGSGVVIIRYP